ncbi:hypothetical protein QTN47_27135 [Danxiaibacter flavus]|uniref:Uncharacterized protein n=1 Tax=Danxiaibacter flavus TaxID=3049108 RepID=A0ABV3ZPM4_9BACT|nr:hypothetical protein QNM32_27135 [Chitinophagaceae bacterium DXS]
MDKVTDFFNAIKDRLSNPFISSALIAWLIFNWRIPVGIFYMNSASEVFNLILQTGNWKTKYLWPLVSASVYTFGFPYIRTCIHAFNSYINNWSTNWNLAIRKDGSVPIGKYLALRNEYKKRTSLLENVIQDERESISQNEQFKTQKMELEAEINRLKDQISRYDQEFGYYIMAGEWQYREEPASEKPIIGRLRPDAELSLLEFRDQYVYKRFENTKNNLYLTIDYFHYDINRGKVVIVGHHGQQGEQWVYYLERQNHRSLKGSLNGIRSVELELKTGNGLPTHNPPQANSLFDGK